MRAYQRDTCAKFERFSIFPIVLRFKNCLRLLKRNWESWKELVLAKSHFLFMVQLTWSEAGSRARCSATPVLRGFGGWMVFTTWRWKMGPAWSYYCLLRCCERPVLHCLQMQVDEGDLRHPCVFHQLWKQKLYMVDVGLKTERGEQKEAVRDT